MLRHAFENMPLIDWKGGGVKLGHGLALSTLILREMIYTICQIGSSTIPITGNCFSCGLFLPHGRVTHGDEITSLVKNMICKFMRMMVKLGETVPKN